jgi:type VI secretion system secreted protein Hcp
MAAYMKMEGLDGESTDSKHDKWIIIESASRGVHRTIPEGARDAQRSRGTTIAGDMIVVRQVDKSTPKLEEACATGKHLKDVEIHLCTMVKDKQEPYLKWKLSDVIVSSYSVHGNAEGSPLPHEELSLNYSKVEVTYVTIDPKTGDPKGNVVSTFDLGKQATK